ncbi:MAG: sulfotransferase family 2 domain-containing protein, partial [Halioglobus sp.]|nr:sulfotransferase family 2 domain-containing protein [Halioglobus sp.]
SFDQFVEYLADANLDLDTGNSHFRRQNKLIDLNEVDYVGRLEKFDKSIYEVFNHLGIPLKDVPIKNGSKKRRHYSTYYTSRSRELIYSMYRKDCELFGYSFEEDRG